jgi:hypothetical protein
MVETATASVYGFVAVWRLEQEALTRPSGCKQIHTPPVRDDTKKRPLREGRGRESWGRNRGSATVAHFADLVEHLHADAADLAVLSVADGDPHRRAGRDDRAFHSTVGFARFEGLVPEIFDLQLLDGISCPEVIEPAAEPAAMSFLFPDQPNA